MTRLQNETQNSTSTGASPSRADASPNLVRLAEHAKHSPAPKTPCGRHYDDVLSASDEEDERFAQAFAVGDLLCALASLRTARKHAATAWAQSMLDSAIAGMEDTLGDVRGWKEMIEESASRSRRK